jgi:hypothetical protein
MITEKMRESFEEWHQIEYPGATLARRRDGEYINLYVGMCLIGWQASRAAIEVELPLEDQNIDYPGYISKQDTESAIESLGLKVKQ